MKLKYLLAVTAAILSLTALAGCAPNKTPNGDGQVETGATESEESNTPPAVDDNEKTGNILVAYFSATGNTRPVAQYAASYTGAVLYEIEAKIPYTANDLKYYTNCRADREQGDPAARPEIKTGVENMEQYDTVFIGYPIWHGQAPKIIYTFIESYDFAGKTVIPFCTSSSSGLGTSADNLHPFAPNASWKDGIRFEIGASETKIKNWIDGLGLSTNEEITRVKVRCKDNLLDIRLADNASAKAFAQKLKDGDITVEMDDYGNFEKVGALGFTLPVTDEEITTSPGDVILYLGSRITIYYDTNTREFTRLGTIKDMTRETMLNFFGGKGKVSVTFSLK